MTPEELRKLHEAATTGPWSQMRNAPGKEPIVRFPTDDRDAMICGNSPGRTGLSIQDARLIAALRNAAPVLLAAWELAEAADDYEDDTIGVRSHYLANGWTTSVEAYDRMVAAINAYRHAKARP